MKMESSIEKIYTHARLRILLHVLFWLLMFGLQWYINSISFNPYRAFPYPVFIQLLVSDILCLVLFYYPFVYFVLPGFYYKKKILIGIILSIVLVVFYASMETVREQVILKPCKPCMKILKDGNKGYYTYLHLNLLQMMSGKVLTLGTVVGLIFSLAIPLGIKMGVSAFRQQLRAVQLAKENVQLELNFLRSQVNPHFLFNTLNNIYGLILKKENEKSAATVARLSQFLRYSLYENNSNKAAVEKELQLLKDYVSLESIRLNYTKVHFNSNDDGSIAIMPSLLMLPVIENAFKYCTDEAGALVRIDFFIHDKKITFAIQNPVDTRRQPASTGGIGLKNFRKRLELHYPGRFTYKVTAIDSTYSAHINIDCYE
ncbi:MAG: histidine kinase [Chitinophagaceae bacterium]